MKNEKEQLKDKINFKGTVKIHLIRQFMQNKNLTEHEFAKLCRIEVEDLRKILDDYSVFEPIWLLKVAKGIGIEFADLVK